MENLVDYGGEEEKNSASLQYQRSRVIFHVYIRLPFQCTRDIELTTVRTALHEGRNPPLFAARSVRTNDLRTCPG